MFTRRCSISVIVLFLAILSAGAARAQEVVPNKRLVREANVLRAKQDSLRASRRYGVISRGKFVSAIKSVQARLATNDLKQIRHQARALDRYWQDVARNDVARYGHVTEHTAGKLEEIAKVRKPVEQALRSGRNNTLLQVASAFTFGAGVGLALKAPLAPLAGYVVSEGIDKAADRQSLKARQATVDSVLSMGGSQLFSPSPELKAVAVRGLRADRRAAVQAKAQAEASARAASARIDNARTALQATSAVGAR